jgi:hypothetical protein
MGQSRAEIWKGRGFGEGTLVGDRGDGFFGLALRQQVEEMGWSHGCPVVPDVIAKYGREWAEGKEGAMEAEIRQAGMEMALARYAECNFWFGYICEAAKINPNLYKQLTSPTARREDEPDGQHSQDLVPRSHVREMSPMSTPAGYALARILIEQKGRDPDQPKEETQKRLQKGLEILDDLIPKRQNPNELAVRLAGAVCQADAGPEAVLSHLLPEGILREENCQSLFDDLVLRLREAAPKLYGVYRNISRERRRGLGMADLRIIEERVVSRGTFTFEGKADLVDYESTYDVVPGVRCDTYKFRGDEGRDLAIVRVEPGARTPVQEVLIEGGRTVEGWMSGRGRLMVIRENGHIEEYVAGSAGSQQVEVGRGDKMQWIADRGEKLVFSEVCWPPYEPGRFADLE